MKRRHSDYVTREDEREFIKGPNVNGYGLLAVCCFCLFFWLGVGWLFAKLL
jgi:hypothetical protein